jgi:ribonucleoside-diphosphate reductase alpha chain
LYRPFLILYVLKILIVTTAHISSWGQSIVTEEIALTKNALQVLRSRYLLKNMRGEIIETPEGMFRRVAEAIAKVETIYDPKADAQALAEKFYMAMRSLEFLPNTPTLMNAGTEIGQLSACFVIPVPDSTEGIFDSVKYMALIHRSGGGTGFSFSSLRPKGDIVRLTKGAASGPVSFMRIFDITTDVIKQGGKRRGANMGILRVDHPDILEFIDVKRTPGVLTNFNISVAVTDRFLKAVEENGDYELIHPRTCLVVGRLNARMIFDRIVDSAWLTGDPGLIFIDEINRRNPTPGVGPIEATNPCGEQPLLPWESCNLGSINLSKFVVGRDLDWVRLRSMVRMAVRFLDNVIDANRYPVSMIEDITKRNRKIGLGVMGFAEMLIRLGVPYNSEEGLQWGEKVMRFIHDEAVHMSVELGETRGSFPNFSLSIWNERFKTMRNATTTTIAPTGTISIIAGTTSGIEPLFAVTYVRQILDGSKLLEVNPLFEGMAKERGFHSEELMRKISAQGSVQKIDEVPEDVRMLFVTALDIDPEWHVRMQAGFQRYTDNAVSKTVNLPASATREDVRRIFLLAEELKCKGITVYRYGSKPQQVLVLMPQETKEANHIEVEPEYGGGCPTGICPY